MTRVRLMTDTITVHVPFRLVKRGGRKEIVLPIGRPVPRNVNDTLVKALARAFPAIIVATLDAAYRRALEIGGAAPAR